jgi:hypothetical protein
MPRLTTLLCSGMLLGCSADATSSYTPHGVAPGPRPDINQPSGQPLIGRFVRSTVQGLAYETASGSGITNEAGEYSFFEGEEVTFRVGGLLIGSAMAKAELTVFDLAGSSAPTVCDRSPFNQSSFDLVMTDAKVRSAVNIETLFHVLDDDGDVSNGIRIAPEVADVFGSDPLDFDLDPNRFDNERPLRNGLAQANALALFPTHRMVPQLPDVAEHLFDFSSSCDQLSYTAVDGNIDPASFPMNVTRNADGRIVEERAYGVLWRTSKYVDGLLTARAELDAMGAVLNKELYTYDDNQLLVRYEHLIGDVLFESQEHTYDADGNRTSTRNEGVEFDGADAYDELVASTFDAFGNVVQVTVDRTTTSEDETVTVHPTSIQQYQYDSNNDMMTYDKDGLVTLFTYDVEHRLTRKEQQFQSTPPTVTTFEYDDAGRQVRGETVTWVSTYLNLYEYDASGRLTRSEFHQDAVLKSTQTREYDEQSRLIESDVEPGSYKTMWTFDDVNEVEQMETVHKPSGTSFHSVTKQLLDKTVLVEFDYDNDGAADASWTEHLESTGVAIRFQDVPHVQIPGMYAE